ncbi:protein PHYLLO, chloroplastic-like [Magnolia sinica]|uniref:protein PHYLLO, chloroplastic-like n=1 Tax=Magnolia sinica TaxID=86752 RepID=UPI00265943E5|nr:protein PHYLLO, chloroplastic-like [Magnolia sinica]
MSLLVVPYLHGWRDSWSDLFLTTDPYLDLVIASDIILCNEPVHSKDDIIKFCEETSLPVALDETIDHIQGDPLNKLMAFVHPGIVVVVIKPSVVEGV